eukprot:2436773-Pyramimonas_sp.AAC.1
MLGSELFRWDLTPSTTKRPPRGGCEPGFRFDGGPRYSFHWIRLHFPDQGNSPGHRCWMGWWIYAKRQV